jgi:hypothetical protein
MREIQDHIVLGDPASQLSILVADEAGSGGANHRYELTGFDTDSNPSKTDEHGYASSFSRLLLLFQNGPIKEAGVNGVSNEALLAIVIDRLRSFQNGPYASPYNAEALMAAEIALNALKRRTFDRITRGVEGLTKA